VRGSANEPRDDVASDRTRRVADREDWPKAARYGRFIKTAEVWLTKASWEQYGARDEPEPLRAGMI
jgi:hypothetical protein